MKPCVQLLSFALLAVAAPAAAESVRATLLCGVLDADGKRVVTLVPTADGRELTTDVHCAIDLEDEVEDLRVDVTVAPAAAGFTAPIAASEDLEFVLRRGTEHDGETHFRSCEDFTITAVISRDGLTPLWEQRLDVEQTCGPGGDVTWENGAAAPALTDPAARRIAAEYAMMVQDNDVPFFAANFPKGKRYRAGRSLKQQLRMWPSLCDQWNCHETWQEWGTWQKSKNEFWLYHLTSPYGEFPALVFKKKGKTWRWTGMKMYSTGEP